MLGRIGEKWDLHHCLMIHGLGFPAVFVKHWNALENPKDCDDFTALWREVYNEVDLQLKEIEDCHFCGYETPNS